MSCNCNGLCPTKCTETNTSKDLKEALNLLSGTSGKISMLKDIICGTNEVTLGENGIYGLYLTLEGLQSDILKAREIIRQG